MTKNLIKSIVLFLLVLFSVVLCLSKGILDEQEFMPLPEAIKRWGHESFSIGAFKQGSIEYRASIAVSLIESKEFIGKTSKDIKTALGDFTGYFQSERIPAYTIEEGWKNKRDTWQLLFLLDSNGRVNDVRIHKNCCYKNSQDKLKRLDTIEKTFRSLTK